MSKTEAVVSRQMEAHPGHWHPYPLHGSLGEHAATWDALNAARFGGHPLLDSRFWNALLQHFGRPGVVLWVLEDIDEPQAMCLLVHRGLGHWASYLPAQAQVGPVMISERSMVQALLRDLRPAAIQVDLLCVDPDLCPIDPLPWQLATVKPHALTMNITGEGSFEDYWAQRPTGLRQNLRRYERRAEADALAFTVRTCRAAAEMPAAVERYALLESRGWKAREDTALCVGNAQTAFYTDLLTRCAQQDQALVVELWAGDRLAASRLSLQAGGVWVMLKTTYDEDLSTVAPGQQLLGHAVRMAFESDQVHTLEFYTNASAAQLAWASRSRWIRHLSFHSRGTASTVWRGLSNARAMVHSWRAWHLESELKVESLPWDTPWPSDVQRLVAGAAEASPEASADWLHNLWRTVYAEHPDTQLWVLRSSTEVLAALPVVVERRSFGHALGFLSNYYTALFVPALARHLSAERLAHLLRHLKRHFRPLGEVRFEPMDPQADHFHLLQHALQLAGFVTHRYYRFGNWYLPSPGSHAAYLKERTAGLRSTIKRMGKRCSDEGGVVEILTDEADLARGLAAYWQVYRASWKVDEPYPAFIDGLAAWCARRGMLRLGLLSLGGQPVAAQIWLVHAGRAEIFKVAYDEAHKAVSPGTVLTAALMERVLDQDRVQEVDFLMGDDGYKRTWMTHRRERWGLIGHDPLRPRALAALARLVGGRLLRHLRPPRPEAEPEKAAS